MAQPFPGTVWTILDASGNPVSGAKVYTYAAGTLTAKAVYTDASLVTASSNPVIADTSGRVTFFMGSGAYRFRVFDSNDVEIPALAEDDINQSDGFGDSLALSSGASLIGWISAAAGAVLRTIQAKLRDEINVKDYGAVADGTFTVGTGVVGGTDNLAAFNAALAAAVSLGISRVKASGVYYLSGKLSLPRGVTLQGDGTAHLPVFLTGANIRGTVLMINGAVGDDCLAFESNVGHSGLRDIAVFNTNTNAIRSVISIVGQLYPRMKNVEYGSLRRTTGAGLYLAPSSTGAAYETLWGQFDNLICSCTGVGTGTEASVRWGLDIYSLGTSSRANSNQFLGGNIAGTWGGMRVDGAVSNSGPLSCTFHGVNFDVIWDTTAPFTPQFQAAAANVFGYTKASCYIYPCVQIKKGFNLSFHACYFESSGAPSTFNDGSNGVQPLVAVAWVDSAAECVGTGFYDCSWNGAYLFDKGTRTACTPTASGHRHDTRFPAQLAVRTGGVQAVPHNTWTKVTTATVLAGDDNELEWDSVNGVAKIRSAGTYMIAAQIEYAGWATSSTFATCRVTGGGVTYVGNTVLQQGASIPITPQISAQLVLAQGDTVTFETLQNQGGSQNTSGANAYLNIVKVA